MWELFLRHSVVILTYWSRMRFFITLMFALAGIWSFRGKQVYNSEALQWRRCRECDGILWWALLSCRKQFSLVLLLHFISIFPRPDALRTVLKIFLFGVWISSIFVVSYRLLLPPVDTTMQWREDWSLVSVVNHSIVTNPTIWQPGFDLPHHTRFLLNRFRQAKAHSLQICPNGVLSNHLSVIVANDRLWTT